VILLMCSWISFADFKFFVSMFIKDIGLWFSFFVVSLSGYQGDAGFTERIWKYSFLCTLLILGRSFCSSFLFFFCFFSPLFPCEFMTILVLCLNSFFFMCICYWFLVCGYHKVYLQQPIYVCDYFKLIISSVQMHSNKPAFLLPPSWLTFFTSYFTYFSFVYF